MDLTVLGATGSVGRQALDVARKKGYTVSAISCEKNIKKAEETVRELNVKLCAVEDEDAGRDLKAALKDTGCKVIYGKGASAQIASETVSDTLLNSITGVAGLMPTVNALKSKKRLALANKESLVTAGEYVMDLAGKNNVEILPVDSEHSEVWQSLRAGTRKEIKRIILTASGGPFFGYTKEKLKNVTPMEALKHPTWNMGSKITIDSATLMNKGFEIIEAKWLFAVDADKIDVVVHRESIIHSMVEYIDNAVIAQLGSPDMRTCIQYALTYPERIEGVAEPIDFTKLSSLTFYEPDTETFPLLRLAKEVLKMGGTYGAALNGANEEAVRLYLMGNINLLTLFTAVEAATLRAGGKGYTPEEALETDKRARAYLRESL